MVVIASTFMEEDAELLAAGFDAIVHKPFRSEEIFDCMEQLLGLRFVRAEARIETEVVPLPTPAALASLPEAVREKLKQMLLALDSERILEIIDEIAQTDPELATALRARAENYDYQSILTLL